MKPKSNIRLMLRQGIKSIVKFKIQFMIILILSFLATFVLTISVTTIRRISNSYDQIVGSQKKFDSTYKLVVGDNATADNGTSFFMPILDFLNPNDTINEVNGTYSYDFKVSKTSDNFISKTVFNILASNDGAEWTRIFSPSNDNSTFEQHRTLVSLGTSKSDYVFDYFHNKTKSEDSSEVIRLSNFLASELFNDLDNNSEYLQNSSIGIFTQKNKGWYYEFQTGESGDGLKTYDWNINFSSLKNKKQNYVEFYQYVFYACQSYWEWINNTLDSADKTNFSNDSEYKEWSKDTAEQAFEFIYGVNFKGESVDVSLFSGDYAKSNYNEKTKELENIIINNTSDESTKSQILNYVDSSATSSSSFDDLIAEKGLKGHINPVIVKETSDSSGNIEYQTTFYNKAYELSGVSSGTLGQLQSKKGNFLTSMSSFSGTDNSIGEQGENFFGNVSKWDDSGNGNMSDSSSINSDFVDADKTATTSAFLMHNKLIAAATNNEVYIRNETIFSDNKTKKKYRTVSIDDLSHTNFKIISGTEPLKKGEIAISEQFAKLNNKKIGDIVKIGDGLFLITAYATDTFSFYPTADPDIPLPKSQTGAIIYATNSTLKELISTDAVGQNSKDSAYQNINVFVYNSTSISSNVDNFYAKLNTSLNNIGDNFKVVNNSQKANLTKTISETSATPQTFFKRYNFSNSMYRINWVLYTAVFNVYLYVSVAMCVIIGLITICTLIISIRKIIQFNSKEIGILKANGVKSSLISMSYVTYSIFITFISIPLGYILATGSQFYIMKILSDYFSFSISEVYIDWISPLAAILIFGLLIGGLCAFFIALITNRKKVLDITNGAKNWSKSPFISMLKKTIFKKSKFGARLSLELTGSGKKTVWSMITFVFIGSFLVSLVLSIPALASYAKKEYFKNSLYSNKYDYLDGVVNSPLSQKSINIWSGPDDGDNNWTEIKSTDNSTVDIDGQGENSYFSKPGLYNSASSSTSIIPTFSFTNSSDNYGIESTYANLADNDGENMEQLIFDSISNNMPIPMGKTISISMIDNVIDFVLNRAGEDYDSLTDETSINKTKNILNTISVLLPQLLSMVDLGTASENIDPNVGTWKDQLLGFLTSMAPPYIKGYISSNSRREQIALGYQFENINPQKETAATTVSVGTNVGDLTVIGLSSNQKAFKISDDASSKVFLDNATSSKISSLLIGETKVLSNYSSPNSSLGKYYDKASNSVILPILVNKQLMSINKWKTSQIIDGLSSTSKKLVLKSEDASKTLVIPSNAWKYDDSQFVNSDYVNSTIAKVSNEDGKKAVQKLYNYEETNGKYYLDPSKINSANLSLRPEYSESESGETKLNNNAFLFGDAITSGDNLLGTVIRPYYQYRDMRLFIPKSLVYESGSDNNKGKVSLSKLINPGNIYTLENLKFAGILKDGATSEIKIKLSDLSDDCLIKNSDVPESTKESYEKLGYSASEDYISIRPYDIRVMGTKDDDFTSKLNRKYSKNFWFNWEMSTALSTKKENVISVESTKNDFNGVDVKFQIVGTLNTYSGKSIIIDQTLANSLLGIDNYNKVSFNNNLFDMNSGTTSSNSQFTRYKLKDISKMIYNTSNPSQDTYYGCDYKDYLVNSYSNTIFSNVEEPTGVTTMISMETENRDGSLSMHDISDTKAKISVSNIVLLQEQKEVIDELLMTSINIAAIFVAIIIIISTILIISTADIYVNKYKRFIIMLRALGYSNTKVMHYVFGISGAFTMLSIIGGITLSWITTLAIVKILSLLGFAMPFTFIMWVPGATAILMLSVWISSIIVSSKRARKEKPSIMMNESNDI